MSQASTSDSRKTVLITGATRAQSLGAALALEFLKVGWRVFATSQAPISQSIALEQKGCETTEFELTDDTSIIKLAEEVKARTGGVLDVLINNVRNSSVVGMFLTHCLGIDAFPSTTSDHPYRFGPA